MTSNYINYLRWFFFFSLLLVFFIPHAHAGDSNLSEEVKINVTVLAPPCEISEDDQSGITASFSQINERLFYKAEITAPEAFFTLHLTNCDINQAKSIHFTFSGTEEEALPGMLALSPESLAKGIAVGIRAAESSTLIKINQQSSAFALSQGDMAFHFIAWLQATPKALASHSIEPGDFTAQAVLSLSYE